MSDKAWGGRFEEELNDVALRYSASVDVDSRLAPQDIRGSIAHVRMLAAQGIVPQADADAIVAGLERLRHEPELRNRLVAAGRDFVRTRTTDVEAGRVVDFIEAVR